MSYSVSKQILFLFLYQIWRDDTSMKSMQIQSSAILTVALNGKWLFTGGWDKTVNIQVGNPDDTQTLLAVLNLSLGFSS